MIGHFEQCIVRCTHHAHALRQTDRHIDSIKENGNSWKEQTHDGVFWLLLLCVRLHDCVWITRSCTRSRAYFEQTDEQTWLEWNNTTHGRIDTKLNGGSEEKKKSLYRPWNEPRQRNSQSAVETEKWIVLLRLLLGRRQWTKRERKEMRKVIRNRTHTITITHAYIHIIKQRNDWLNRERHESLREKRHNRIV